MLATLEELERFLKMRTSNALRRISSRLISRCLEIGDSVEFVDDTPSPMGKIVKTLTIGRRYKVVAKHGEAISVKNNKGWNTFYYANRFRKI